MWEYSNENDSDVTTWYWGGNERAQVDGEPTEWKDGRPQGEHRDAIHNIIKSTDTPERIGMQLDYIDSKFEERDDSDSS